MSTPGSAVLAVLGLLSTACTAHLLSVNVPRKPVAKESSQNEQDGAASRQETQDDRQSVGGLFYTLPRTVIKVAVPMELSFVKEGELTDFCQLFFPFEKLSATRKLKVERPTLATSGEPDPTQVYYMRVAGRGTLDQSLTFTFNSEGAVTGLKAEVTDTRGDLLIAGAKAGLGLLTKGFVGSALATEAAMDSGFDCSVVPAANNWETHFVNCFLGKEADPDLRAEFLREIFGSLGEQEKKPLKWAYLGLDAEQGEPGPEGTKNRLRLERASRAYALYNGIVRGLNSTLTAEDVAAGAGFEAFSERRVKTAAALKGKFIGEEKKVPWQGSFEVRPTRTNGKTPCDPSRDRVCKSWTTAQPLFSYVPDGEGAGLCSTHSVDPATPPPDTIMVPKSRQSECQTATKAVDLQLSLEPDDQIATRVAGTFRSPADAAVFFIVPARMRATIGGTVAGDLMIAQFGIVTAMPSEMGGKSFTHDLAFYDETGALKSYTLASKPLVEAGSIDAISKATSDLIEARRKQMEEEKKASSDVAKLGDAAEKLELLKRIQEACAALENPPEECEE